MFAGLSTGAGYKANMKAYYPYDAGYSKEYDALESEKNGLKAIIIEPESDYSSVESLLQKDFLAIYHSLAEENRRTFWRNIIRQIHLKPDYTINYVDFVQSVSV